MTLTFNDRLTILFARMLPESSDKDVILEIIALKGKVAFSPAEKIRLNLQDSGHGSFNYQTKEPLENFSKEVEFTAAELEWLAKGAKLLNDNLAVTEDTVYTVIKFLQE